MFTTTTLPIAVAVLVFVIDVAHIEGRPTDSLKIYNVQACGKELADLLQTTCLLGYNTYHAGANVDENDLNRNREKRNTKKRGITQECCLQPCKWTDLLSYCYNGSSANSLPTNWPELVVQGVNFLHLYGASKRVIPSSSFNSRTKNSETHQYLNDNELYFGENDTGHAMFATNEMSTVANTKAKMFKFTPQKSVNYESVAPNEIGVSGNVKSISLYHYGKTPIIVNNKTVESLAESSRLILARNL